MRVEKERGGPEIERKAITLYLKNSLPSTKKKLIDLGI
jgi:hypothetical protein